jgi:hypothetical protein
VRSNWIASVRASSTLSLVPNAVSQNACKLRGQEGVQVILTRLPPWSPFGCSLVKRDVACSGW